MNSYTFEIDHFLSDAEIGNLSDQCYPRLLALNERYTPELDIESAFPCKPEYLDVLRTSWLLDKTSDRPCHSEVVEGLGFAFGLLLGQLTSLRWCAARDQFGDFVAMVRIGENDARISVPVFAYVDKRESLQNAEVFVDFFNQISSDILGSHV